MLRKMNPGETISFRYNPDEMKLTTIRSTASALGVDTNSKYSVCKIDKEIMISREKTSGVSSRKGVQSWL